MSLTPGSTLGPYEVVAKIGEGGMGEVYRARDAKLDRDVALKVLPQAFTDDPDRLARFSRPPTRLLKPLITRAFALWGAIPRSWWSRLSLERRMPVIRANDSWRSQSVPGSTTMRWSRNGSSGGAGGRMEPLHNGPGSKPDLKRRLT